MRIRETIQFPKFTGLRCLMMPYVQGDSKSVPEKYRTYADILDSIYVKRGDIGYLTIDESLAERGTPHRGTRAKTSRAIHTEVGICPSSGAHQWGTTTWGGSPRVRIERDVQVLISSNLDDSCAVWDAVHENTSLDGDIGYASKDYPYSDATLLKSGQVCQLGILTPHESLPVKDNFHRQFLRIVSKGVHGRETYFTYNPILCA